MTKTSFQNELSFRRDAIKGGFRPPPVHLLFPTGREILAFVCNADATFKNTRRKTKYVRKTKETHSLFRHPRLADSEIAFSFRFADVHLTETRFEHTVDAFECLKQWGAVQGSLTLRATSWKQLYRHRCTFCATEPSRITNR